MLFINYQFTNLEFTTIKFCSDIWCVPEYEEVFEFELPVEYDQLVLDSFEYFPFHILVNKKINCLRLYCLLEMNDENFDILHEIYLNGTEIKFYKNSIEYVGWFDSQLRIKTIRTILE